MSRMKSIRNGDQSITDFFGDMNQEYKAAKTSRFQRKRPGINSLGTSADYHVRSDRDYFFMMELARDLERNDIVVGQGMRRTTSNIVQNGFTLDCNTGDQGLDDELQGMWSEWSTNRDQASLTGEMDFCQIERMAFNQMLVDGDVCILPTNQGSLELIEGHRLRTPRTKLNVVLGVLLDKNRRRRQYWFTKDDIEPRRSTSSLKVNDMRKIDARDGDGNRQVFHIYNPRRITQTRGITVLAPVTDTAGMLDDIQFARLVQQMTVSAWCILREPPEGFIGKRTDGTCNTESATNTLPETLNGTIGNVAAGMDVRSMPGEKITGFSPNVPNPQFFDHTNLILTFIAINLDLPVAVLLLDPSNTNFSGWRGAIDQARMSWRVWQKWYASVLHRPVFEWKLRNWIAGDARLQALAEDPSIKIARHLWHPPRWPYIEPLKDAAADVVRDRNGQISKRRLQAEQGREWSQVASEIVDDNALAITLAKKKQNEINAEFEDGNPVHWRELISLPAAEGVKIMVSTEDGNDDASSRRNDKSNAA